MTIAYITSAYGRASDTFIRREVRELRGMGHTVLTFSIRRPEPEQVADDDAKSEQTSTQYILEAGPARLLVAGILMLFARPKRMWNACRLVFNIGPEGIKFRVWQVAYLLEASMLACWLEKYRVQHLHDHIGENSATVAMLASKLAGIPFSMTIHGPGIFHAIERFSLGRKILESAFTVCISEFCRSQCMVFTAPKHWDRLRIVRCGVDAKSIGAQPIDSNAKPKIVSVGRLCAEKGHLILIEAAARVAAEGLDFELVIVGDGPMRADIEQKIREKNASSFVRLAGWGGSETVRREMVGSRAVALASFAEGLPVVLMEALSLGRPVISTSIAGVPELVEAGVNGWLVPPGSVEAMTGAIRQAMNSPVEELQAMGCAGVAKVTRQHNVATEVAKLAELFSASVSRIDQTTQPKCVSQAASAPSIA